MKWLNCIKQIISTHKSGNCPHCGSANTDYKYVLVDKENSMGYLDVWCNDCKKLGHISRVKIPKDVNAISIEVAKEVVPRYEVVQ